MIPVAHAAIARTGIFETWDAFEGQAIDMIGGIATVLAFVVFFIVGARQKFSFSAMVTGALIAAGIIVLAVLGGLSVIAEIIVDTFSNL